MVKTAFFTKDVRCLLENVPFLPKTLGIKKDRQRKADGKEEIDDLIDVKLAKLQRKADGGEFRIIDFESEE